MLAIILSACLANEPSVCREYKIQLQEQMDTLSCAMYAPPYLVPWSEEHPGWQIKRWRCAPASEDDI
ncbi:MAG TPA: hypothetical protein PKD49_12860 [Hyphomicrobium sp.]|nr:hypothetical protein [Hyphomicrobium sp.]